MSTMFLAQASGVMALSWWKALLFFFPFIGWAWLIGNKLDKDARFHHLNVTAWNSAHLIAGLIAFGAMLFLPIFWAGWPVGVAILYAPIMVYWKIRNEAVPVNQQFYLTGATIAERFESRRVKKAARNALIQFKNSKGIELAVPMKDDPEYPVHMLSEDLLGPAIDDRATRLELNVTPKGCAIARTVDSVRFRSDPINTDDALKIIDYIKGIAGLDVEDRRRRQKGQCQLIGPDGKVELTLTTAGSSSGQSLRIDFDLQNQINKPFDLLGMLPAQLEVMRALEEGHERHGTFLVGAPHGQGLTTTCYALLSRHDAYIANIKTLEREILLRLDGPDQIQFDPSNPDIDYATNLLSILRRDPDVVLTAEAKESEVAQIIAESNLDGPLIYVPQVLGSIVDQIRTWVKLVGNVREATSGLRMVSNQRLLRKLCSNCRQAYQPTPDQLRKLNLPPNKVKELYKAGGKIEIKGKIENCQICKGSGYLGQIAAFEVLDVNVEIRKILSTGDMKSAMSHARRNKMIYLQEAALSRVISGETTVEEVIRVTTTSKNSKKST